MVRFSDLLGGNDDADDARPATVSAPLVTEPEPPAEPVVEPPTPAASPEDVLDRLTQYATSARAGDPVPDTAEPVPEPVDEAPSTEEAIPGFQATGDDLLPRSGARKPSRGRKRRP